MPSNQGVAEECCRRVYMILKTDSKIARPLDGSLIQSIDYDPPPNSRRLVLPYTIRALVIDAYFEAGGASLLASKSKAHSNFVRSHGHLLPYLQLTEGCPRSFGRARVKTNNAQTQTLVRIPAHSADHHSKQNFFVSFRVRYGAPTRPRIAVSPTPSVPFSTSAQRLALIQQRYVAGQDIAQQQRRLQKQFALSPPNSPSGFPLRNMLGKRQLWEAFRAFRLLRDITMLTKKPEVKRMILATRRQTQRLDLMPRDMLCTCKPTLSFKRQCLWFPRFTCGRDRLVYVIAILNSVIG